MKINISKYLSVASLYENLAEEAAELAAAASKTARVLRDENPTPTTYVEGVKHVIEEYTDVINIANALYLNVNKQIQSDKLERWSKRILDKYEPKKEDSSND